MMDWISYHYILPSGYIFEEFLSFALVNAFIIYLLMLHTQMCSQKGACGILKFLRFFGLFIIVDNQCSGILCFPKEW